MSEAFASIRAGEFATARKGGMDSSDLAFIRSRIRASYPLSAIAKMIQRPLPELQALFDEPEGRPAWEPPELMQTAGIIVKDPPRRVRGVLNRVGDRHGVGIKELLSDKRTRRISHARFEACWELRQMGISYPEIARHVGMKDHTSALHAVRRHEELTGATAA